MSAETPTTDDSAARKRRRRRRRRRTNNDAPAEAKTEGKRSRGGDSGPEGPPVSTPNPNRRTRKRRKRRRRGAAIAGLNRRRRLTRSELDELEAYFNKIDPLLLGNLYRGLGGQPSRVNEHDRMVQLAVRAIAQGKRLGTMLKQFHQKERTALALLIQCGGLAHSEEFLRELHLSLGGGDREWVKVMQALAEKGLVCATVTKDDQFFYLVPEPLVEHLVEHLTEELAVGIFKSEDIRATNARPFCPPMDFSITTLCTYIAQRPPRLTQQQDIFKTNKQEMDEFFAQLWESDSELFHFHIDFLVKHGLVELRGDRLAVNREVVEEWLRMDPEDQRDLIFAGLDSRFTYSEWVMWAVHSGKGEWVPERPLQALYRRWTRGEDWRTRFHKGEFGASRTHERESWSFAPLVNCGMLELGEWGQEKFYRLTPRALAMVEPPEEEEFTQFYLMPSFEIMAPAGISPIMLFHIGELAELTSCDRANTYKIAEISIEQALDKGWKRDAVLDFLRNGSQMGLPENVEQTLKSWMGGTCDVEFHDCVLLTVHKSRIRKLEATRELKPFLLHRFVPGLYAIDRTKLPELMALLDEHGLNPGKELHQYPGDPEQVGARERLHDLLGEARAASEDPLARAHAADTQPQDLHPVPGTTNGVGRKRSRKKKETTQRMSTREVRQAMDKAVALRQEIDVVYLGKEGERTKYKLRPQRLALNPKGDQVVVAINNKDELRTYKIERIERVQPS